MSKIAENTAELSKRGGAVRLTLAATVANDLGALKESLKSLAERLGHPACATGCDILHLGLEREFTVNRAGRGVALNAEINPGIGFGFALPQDPIPIRDVRVAMPGSVFNNIDSLASALERVVGKLGCSECCSGFDILFQREVDMLRLDANLKVSGFGRFA